MNILHATQPPAHRKVIEVVCDGFLGRFVRRRNWAAVTIPLAFVVLILYWVQADPLTWTHEFVHVEQPETLALVGFWVSYIRNAIKSGYAHNVMEEAAYAVEDEARKNGLPSWAQA